MEKRIKVRQVAERVPGMRPPKFMNYWMVEDMVVREELLTVKETVERFSDVLTEEEKSKLLYGDGEDV